MACSNIKCSAIFYVIAQVMKILLIFMFISLFPFPSTF